MTSGERGLVAALLLILAAVYLPWTWSGQLGSLGADPSVYVLSARHYAAFLPDDPVASSIARHTQFPPLYPMLLAITGGASSVPVAHAVTVLTLLAAVGAAYFWFRVLGLGIAFSLFGAVAFALIPGTWRLALIPNSEGLYTALVLLGLALTGLPPERRRYGAAATILSAALLTRTAGLALLPAWLAASSRIPRRRAAALLLWIAGPAAAWGLLHRPEWGYGSDVSALLSRMAPESAMDYVAGNAAALGRGMLDSLVPSAALEAVVLPMAGIAGVAGLVRLARGQADAWYAASYLAMMSLWPFPEEAMRFTWPVLPIFIGYALWGSGEALRRVTRQGRGFARRWAPAAAAVVLALALLPGPGVVLAWTRWQEAGERGFPALRQLPEWYGRDREAAYRHGRIHLALAKALAELPAHVPDGDCVISVFPPAVGFYGARDGVAPPASDVPPAAFQRLMAATGCAYVLLVPATSATFPEPFYPGERIPAGARTVRVWRLGGPDADAERVLAVLIAYPA